MLEGSALAWLNSLPESNIHDWKDLCDTFIKNFEGMYAWPGTAQDLWNHVQKDGESVREFINRWTRLRNSIENVSKPQAIPAFKQGVTYELLRQKLA